MTGIDLEIENYGKPIKFNYDFSESHLRRRCAQQKIKLSRFYMIGDNPLSDIAGANAKGWVSILVRTGIYRDDAPTSENSNDTRHPATHVVDNVLDAIKLIYKLEKLDFD